MQPLANIIKVGTPKRKRGARNVACVGINPLNARLIPICPLLALFGAHHILHVSGVRVNVHTIVVGKPKETAHLEETQVDGR
jgi:hypothetical protein